MHTRPELSIKKSNLPKNPSFWSISYALYLELRFRNIKFLYGTCVPKFRSNDIYLPPLFPHLGPISMEAEVGLVADVDFFLLKIHVAQQHLLLGL